MRRAVVPLGIAVAAIAVYLIVAQDDPPPPAPAPAGPDATAVAPKEHLPSIKVRDEPQDAALPDGALTFEIIRYKGLAGRPVEWIPQFMAEYRWQAVDGEPYTYTGGNDVRLTYIVEGGRVSGIAATFPERSLSADATALSGFIIGEHAALPMHFEVDEPPDEPETGEFELDDGRKFYYRGSYRKAGNPPYGPSSVEVSVRPF